MENETTEIKRKASPCGLTNKPIARGGGITMGVKRFMLLTYFFEQKKKSRLLLLSLGKLFEYRSNDRQGHRDVSNE